MFFRLVQLLEVGIANLNCSAALNSNCFNRVNVSKLEIRGQATKDFFDAGDFNMCFSTAATFFQYKT